MKITVWCMLTSRGNLANIHLDEDVFCLQDVLIETNIFSLNMRLQKTSSKRLVQGQYNIRSSRYLPDVFNTFWRHLLDMFKMSSRRLAKMSSRQFQDVSSSQTVLFNTSSRPSKHLLVLKTSWRHLARRLEDMSRRRLEDMSWRRLEDISWRCLEDMSWRCLEDMSWRRLEDMSWRCLEDISWRRLEDTMEGNKILTGNICI